MLAQDLHFYSDSIYMGFPVDCTEQEAVWAQSVVLLVCRRDKYLFHCIMNGSRIYHQSVYTYINIHYQMFTKMLNALSIRSVLTTCVTSLVVKLCVTHLCPVGFEYTNILCLTSLRKSFEEQLKGEERKHHTDMKFYTREKRQLRKELEALKVSVPYMRMTLQYSHIS